MFYRKLRPIVPSQERRDPSVFLSMKLLVFSVLAWTLALYLVTYPLGTRIAVVAVTIVRRAVSAARS